ncbi:MAG: regulatory protein RecX [Schwartzia sp. (in: firmicutes)]
MKKPNPPALHKAVELLARQEHSTAKLREKLLRRGYPAEEIEAALARLTEKQYLDDDAACRREFQYFYEESAMSVRQICQKLHQRGFSSALVTACVPEDTAAREERAAQTSLSQKFRTATPREKMKAFLYRRGFSYTICERTTEIFLAKHPDWGIEEAHDFDE